MFESIYNTEALLLAVKLNQRFHREREKFPSASPPLPNAPWHPGARAACGAMQGHGAGCGGKPFGHGKKKTAVSPQTKRPHRAEGLAAAPWRRRPRGLRNERAGQHSAQLDASPNHSLPLPAKHTLLSKWLLPLPYLHYLPACARISWVDIMNIACTYWAFPSNHLITFCFLLSCRVAYCCRCKLWQAAGVCTFMLADVLGVFKFPAFFMSRSCNQGVVMFAMLKAFLCSSTTGWWGHLTNWRCTKVLAGLVSSRNAKLNSCPTKVVCS